MCTFGGISHCTSCRQHECLVLSMETTHKSFSFTSPTFHPLFYCFSTTSLTFHPLFKRRLDPQGMHLLILSVVARTMNNVDYQKKFYHRHEIITLMSKQTIKHNLFFTLSNNITIRSNFYINSHIFSNFFYFFICNIYNTYLR